MKNSVLFKADKPLIISGPCSAETREQTLETCQQLAATGKVDVLRAGVWKPRTKPGSFEGSGVRGLAWMVKAKQLTGLPIAVEVATTKHVEQALEYGVDILWIGARTTGNPFSVQEIADALRGTNVPVFIKNPMTPDIDLWIGAVERMQKAGIEDLALIHRGFSWLSGEYRNHPMWHLAIEVKRRLPELMMICDPSHICGNREKLAEVAQKAADLNYNGLIIESHINPDNAWSDASQQITPQSLEELLRSIVWRKENTDRPEFIAALEILRGQIDQIDSEVLTLLGRRMKIADQIGEIKRDNNVSILQTTRWSEIMNRIMIESKPLGLSDEFMETILNAIHIESINRQNKIMNGDESL